MSEWQKSYLEARERQQRIAHDEVMPEEPVGLEEAK
jgi:hypothetical protein